MRVEGGIVTRAAHRQEITSCAYCAPLIDTTRRRHRWSFRVGLPREITSVKKPV
jgi:hypothetical protein